VQLISFDTVFLLRVSEITARVSQSQLLLNKGSITFGSNKQLSVLAADCRSGKDLCFRESDTLAGSLRPQILLPMAVIGLALCRSWDR
jgi:hypothetical protein